MFLLGIFTGLLCALSHSICYLTSKNHAVRHPGRTLFLLLYGQLLMSLAALPLVIILWPGQLPAFAPLAGFLGGSILFYIGGQWAMISAMHHAEPSRVSPLLGIKVILMGLFATLVYGFRLSPQQWIALALCTAGAVSLGISGGRLTGKAQRSIFLAACCYVLSDSCIERLVQLFAHNGMPLFRAALFALGLTYSLIALLTLCTLPWVGGWQNLTRNRKEIVPFAAFWIIAMAFYYITLGLVGPVFGVVLQSTRGILSVFLGLALVKLKHRGQLEQPLGKKVFLQRLAAATLMFSAIALYATGIN
jgi:drug/metabolite transporter (DMT)-like permease